MTRRAETVCAFLAVMLMWIARESSALGPHELLVLVNSDSPGSAVVGESFAEMRRVPAQNIVRLNVPDRLVRSDEISAEEFTELIWNPARRAARDRGVDKHVLAWVYSAGFPARVTLPAPVSVTGMTFLRNVPPRQRDIAEGRYRSPLFAGPGAAGKTGHSSMSFDAYRRWLGGDMPLPAMMLGYTGRQGNSIEEILQSIQNGVRSDGTCPSGTVYFVVSDDVRSTCRDWQFPGVVGQLRNMRVNAVITKTFPRNKDDIIGLMTGSASVKPGLNSVYLPGCMAEHLTSSAADFRDKSQTKFVEWIRSGTTASCGTVTEPMSIWTKFPNAWFYVHYSSGCTMMESFYQSVFCPLQLLIVGDPLAQPWKPSGKAVIEVDDDGHVSGKLRAGMAPDTDDFRAFVFLMDGVQIGHGRVLEYDVSNIAPGKHLLRGVAYRAGMMSDQVMAELEIVTGKGKK